MSKAPPKELKGTALLRLDFNTEDDWRLAVAVPTIKFLLRHADRVIVLSHKGRPNGFTRALSLKNDAKILQKDLKRRVSFIPHFRFGEIRKAVNDAPRGSIFVLENLRFLPGEEKNDPKFAKMLAEIGDYYVNDAFAVCHRANASVVAITKFITSYAGLELEKEIATLSRVLVAPRHPFVLILGGAKARDKLGVLHHFRKSADAFLIGGASANTLLALRGMDVKKSERETDSSHLKELCPVLRYLHLILPVDYVWGNDQILDIGPRSIALFSQRIRTAKTIFWSGPLGMIENGRYIKGNLAIARAIASNRKALSVTGGGETVSFLRKHRLGKKFSFISTGGGAMLDFLAGKKLPGIEALK